MNKKNLALLIGFGIVGAVALGGGIFAKNKAKAKKQLSAGPAKPEKPDTQPGMVVCPGCGNKFKEYEFFCPFCKRPVDEAYNRWPFLFKW